MMELVKAGGGLQIKACSYAPLTQGVVINDEIADAKTFTFLLKQALQKPQFGRLGSSYVVASLPESKSFVRVVQIPKMSESEAESAVPYEAENFIPLPLDQVYLDWEKIGESGDKMNVLMIATPKTFVDKYLEILDSVGLKTVALEVESQSCRRALISPDNPENVLLIDLDASRSSLIMIEEGNIQFTSTIPVAGNTFTDAIARVLGVSAAKAEQVKQRVGISNTAEYPNIQTSLLPILNNLSSEIKNILRFHSEHSDKQVSKVVLLGGTSKLKNLPEYLAPQLQEAGIATVEVANPWINLPNLKSPPISNYDALSFVTAIGLAKRGMEFEV